MVALMDDADATRRAARADVLGEVANGDPELVDRVLPVLELMASAQNEPTALCSIAHALGRLWDPRTAPQLVTWQAHPNDNLRFEVASSLRSYSDESDESTIAALLELSRDSVPLVRDWATFHLASSGASGPAVVAALFDRIDDEDLDTQAEAFMGLAERGNDAIVEPLIAVLNSDSVGPSKSARSAKLADERLFESLKSLEARWGDTDREALTHAIRRCDPSLRPSVTQTESRIVADLHRRAVSGGSRAMRLSRPWVHIRLPR